MTIMGSSGHPHRTCSSWLESATARAVLAVLLWVSAVNVASPAVVFEQAPVDGADAFPSISAAQSADGFALSMTTGVTGLSWWGSYSQDPATLPVDAFSVRIFASNAGAGPKTIPATTITQQPTRSATSLFDKTGAPVYRFDLVFALLSLAGGMDWYLSVVNAFDVGDPNAVWYWLLSSATGENFYRFVDGDPWSSDPTGNLAFQIRDSSGTSIPLPGSLFLALFGLLAMRMSGGVANSRSVGSMEES